MRLKYCKDCGRFIDNEFSYCPWCGKSQTQRPETKNVIERTFDIIEENLEAAQLNKRIGNMEQELAIIEVDLELFLETRKEHS